MKENFTHFFFLFKKTDLLSVQLKRNPVLFSISQAQVENFPIYLNSQQTKFTPVKSRELARIEPAPIPFTK